jgi:hypothetical protein
MVVRSVKDQYQGINAHLHSLLQAQGGWNAFHTAHIGDLNKTLKAQLSPMGYTTGLEPSVQIRRLDEPIAQPESDVAIYDLDPLRPQQKPIPYSASTHEWVLPVAESSLSEKIYSAVGIYELIPESHQAGDLVAWLELLSPSNKGQSEDARLYREKRLNLLRSGVVFVELDYLHESPPTFIRLPRYRPQDEGSYPYRIVVIDPRPDFDLGQAHIHEFDVDAPIPLVTIPLNAGDVLAFDFGIPYQKTYEEMLYGLEWVDYSQLPPNFKRYTPTDQLRILTRMLTVVQAATAGENLETPPCH